mgnify:CR=1 FL=1
MNTKQYRLLFENNDLFDSGYYLRRYADVRAKDMDSWRHYFQEGWKQQRIPSELAEQFSDSWDYTAENFQKFVESIEDSFPLDFSTSRITEDVRLYTRCLNFIKSMDGPVIVAGYPYESKLNDGYYQRIKAIDSVFGAKQRVYLDVFDNTVRAKWAEFIGDRVLVLKLRAFDRYKFLIHRLNHKIFSTPHWVYFHSLLALNCLPHLMDNSNAKIILDLHGAVPEELAYEGKTRLAEHFEEIESKAVRRANWVISVSEALQHHIEAKHNLDLHEKSIILPIFEKIEVTDLSKPQVEGRYRFVYAGGTQPWQLVPEMMEVVNNLAADHDFSIFSGQPDQFRGLLDPAVTDSVKIESIDHEELLREYSSCHFGFALRDESVVNRVACPTKIVEYLSTGVVPVLKTAHIGDFVSLGMKYLPVSDAIQNELPGVEERDGMAALNQQVYSKLLSQYESSVKQLKEIIN